MNQGVSLRKGGNVSLSKEDPGLKAVMVGLGWDEKPGTMTGYDFDLDAMCFLLTADGRVRNEDDFIFYNNLKSPDENIQHQGDNLTGAGEGDDEQILMNLSQLTMDIQKIIVAVNIHEALQRGQNFGMVSNAFMRIVNPESNREIARYDLTEDYSNEAAMIFGEIYRHNGEWKFRAVGAGWRDGLPALCAQYGVPANY